MNHEDEICEELFTDPEEIVAFAQAYYATEFPNSQRSECPPAEKLHCAANSGALPEPALRGHLFHCSECFRIFRSARISQRPQVASSHMWYSWQAIRTGLAPNRVFVWASLTGFVFSVAAAAMLIWGTRKEPVIVSQNAQEQVISLPTPVASAEPQGAVEQPSTYPAQDALPKRSKPPVLSPRRTQGLRVIEINLKEENLLRDADEVKTSPYLIRLSPTKQRLRLQLPEGSASGRYTVSVLDAFGKSVIIARANSNGKTLTVDLDLRGLAAKKYRLCLSRGEEAPDCYLVSVSEQVQRVVK